MNKIILVILTLLLFSCNGKPLKKDTKGRTINYSSKVSDNCYDYLTELVRSSNFPFSEWKMEKNKVNLLIDNDNNRIISCKVFVDTEGTGTIGWIEFHKNDGKLFNTSANLDRPVELKYNKKWKELFDSCSSKVIVENTLEKVYGICNELSLPVKYDFDAINEEKGFIDIGKEYYKLFPFEHQDNYKMAKLSTINNDIKPVILITHDLNGQSTWYLLVLNSQYKVISNIILYTNEEIDNGGSKYITYNISKDYKISINQFYNEKLINKADYIITKNGLIDKK
ncbi:hypothetical protein [Chryseobacterium lineare]